MTRAARHALGALVAGLAGCGPATVAEPVVAVPAPEAETAERTFAVTAVRCSDGTIDLDAGGVVLRVRVKGELRTAPAFVVEESREDDRCAVTSIWRSEPVPDEPGARTLTEEARVAYPPGSACDVFPEGTREGRIEGESDAPTWIVRRSRMCGGLVATFRLAEAAGEVVTPDALVRRWMADVVVGDFDEAVDRFDGIAVLVPPPLAEEAVPRRIEGREAIRAWHEESFAETSWRAMRLVALEVEGPRAEIEWEYVDEASRRDGPVRGRAEVIASGAKILELRFEGVPTRSGAD